MGKKPKKRSAEFKFKMVLETIQKGNVAEVARKYVVNPNQLSMWRKQFFETGSKIFEESPGKAVEKYRKKIEQLEGLIGKKEVEISILKKFLDFYASHEKRVIEYAREAVSIGRVGVNAICRLLGISKKSYYYSESP